MDNLFQKRIILALFSKLLIQDCLTYFWQSILIFYVNVSVFFLNNNLNALPNPENIVIDKVI